MQQAECFGKILDLLCLLCSFVLHLQQVKGGDSVLCSTLMRHHPPEHCIQLWGPKERHGLTGVNPEGGHQGLEHLLCEVELRDLELLHLEERRLWGDPVAPSST